MGKERIYENLAENIGLENFKIINKKNQRIKNILQKTLTVVVCSLSITGMVFARDISTKIYENVYNGGNGYGKAISEGYVEQPKKEDEVSISTIEDEETGEIIEDLDTKIKVEEFVMDDFSLSMTLDITLSDKIKDIVKIEDIWDINFPDLVIYDEDYNVLYNGYGKTYEEFCKEKNIEPNEDEKWYGSGVNGIIIDKNGNHVKRTFNIYLNGPYYPKSKQINLELSRMRVGDEVEGRLGEEDIVIKGDWKISIDVPEKMYNRTDINYVQKSTTNKDFNVTQATVYDTGMMVTLEFPTEKQPDPPTIPEVEFFKSLPDDDELKTDDISTFVYHKLHYSEEYMEYLNKRFSVWDDFNKYLTNSNGDKFDVTLSNRENGGGGIDENGIYTDSTMYDLTKFDMTDEITLHVNYQGREAEIILEKDEVE